MPNRKERRAAARAGTLLSARYRVSERDIERAEVDSIDILSHYIDRGLRELDAAGGDVLEYAVVTLGRHPLPEYAGAIIVEVKTNKLKATKPEAIDPS